MTTCKFCLGHGHFAGTYGDIICPDCDGEASWEPEPDDTGITLDELRARYALLDLSVSQLTGNRYRVAA